VSRKTALAFLQLLAPFAPHLAEELWERLGEPPSISRAPWPTYDPAKLVNDQVKLVFQVNGRVRGDQLVPVGLTQEEAIEVARAHPRVKLYIDGKSVKKIIYVPGRILNLVVD
jgi:leucyl-tRNA synthetase